MEERRAELCPPLSVHRRHFTKDLEGFSVVKPSLDLSGLLHYVFLWLVGSGRSGHMQIILLLLICSGTTIHHPHHVVMPSARRVLFLQLSLLWSKKGLEEFELQKVVPTAIPDLLHHLLFLRKEKHPVSDLQAAHDPPPPARPPLVSLR
ncbi:hypothetical protein NHX12_013820 [Muraenolepis orangiensis]|uniref:Uncharacterized protein n=1 Tax=Muraenolepis orangiensis TaxID=630683 RepID=A0A9Q0DAP0_9TELE|nr:hypothetical protein NHX12_013820 [Muraenolepis orangiensis]